jgi:hypothetical protein
MPIQIVVARVRAVLVVGAVVAVGDMVVVGSAAVVSHECLHDWYPIEPEKRVCFGG